MKGRLGSQVNPRVTAAAILIVLVAVQWVWWKGLVARPRVGGGPMSGTPPGGASDPAIFGRADVVVETIAGTPEPGDADGPGRDARFDGPTGLAVDAQGNLYVADTRNCRIRRVAPDGTTTTLAGGEPGCADGPAGQAQFRYPCGVAVARDGTVYVADTGNQRIRRIAHGQVATVPVGGGQGAPLKASSALVLVSTPQADPSASSMVIADTLNARVVTVGVDGATLSSYRVPGTPTSVAVLAARGAGAAGLPLLACAVPQAGDVRWPGGLLHRVPVDHANASAPANAFAIRRPIALCPAPGGFFAIDGASSAVFYVRGGRAQLLAGACFASGRRLSGWDDSTGDKAHFGQIGGLAYDGQGHLYVTDTTGDCIRRITLPRDLSTPPAARRERRNDYYEEVWP